ncbi:hypothetical protein OH77DRAFT_1475938 [Trametes cingulata]|nr:hypothetical protein OH77DRAFT_1475938 [Trametes cingulata]
MDRASSSDSSSGSPPRATGLEDDLLPEGPPEYPSFGNFGHIGDPKAFNISNMQMKRISSGRPMMSSDGAPLPKARRKDPRGGPSGPPSMWEQGSLGQANRQRDELVDQGLVEQLRNQFGDPFDDTIMKKGASTDSA